MADIKYIQDYRRNQEASSPKRVYLFFCLNFFFLRENGLIAVLTLPSDIISPAKEKNAVGWEFATKKTITDIGLFIVPVGPLTFYWFIFQVFFYI